MFKLPLIVVLLFKIVNPDTFNDDNIVVLSFNKVVPLTCNNALGAEVPIPTLPFVCILIFSLVTFCVNVISLEFPTPKPIGVLLLYMVLGPSLPFILKPAKYE